MTASKVCAIIFPRHHKTRKAFRENKPSALNLMQGLKLSRRLLAMKEALMKLIYFLAEKGKMIGINRGKLKALLYPAYRLFCYVIYRIGEGGCISITLRCP